MRKYLTFSSLILLTVLTMISCSPNPKDILAGAYTKCQSVKSGYYEMDHYWKMMSRNDTMKISQKSHFKKIENDSIIPFIFQSYLYCKEMGEINLLYTGNEFVMHDGKEGMIIPRKDNGNNVWLVYNKNTALNPYLPITYKNSKLIPNLTTLTSEKFTPTYVKQVEINNIPCYQINAIVAEEFDPSLLKGGGYIIKTDFNYWISKQDSIPIQITASRYFKVGKDTLVEFEKFVLNKYNLNQLPNDSILFTLDALPSHINLSSPIFDTVENLRMGDIAPDWRLPSLKGDTLSLADFRGDLILLDFFIVSCPPCVEILPHLHNLHEKYKGQGLHMIGLDKLDSQKALENFVSRHGIDYPILLNNRYVNDAYHVSNYPTLYLIGKDGKILFHVRGYVPAALEELEYTIQQQFK